jgi:hypothetical protein
MPQSKSKYTKKVTVSFTPEDYSKLEKLAEDDRRTTAQKASFMIEDAIDAIWTDDTGTNIG